MFFARDAQVRAGDSHGDIVFWPLVALADYLRASGDAGLLDAVLPYHADASLHYNRTHCGQIALEAPANLRVCPQDVQACSAGCQLVVGRAVASGCFPA